MAYSKERTELFADLEKEMARFRADFGKSTTPRMWILQETEYGGTFVFLNPKSTSPWLTREEEIALGVTSRPKSNAEQVGAGLIEVYSANGGQLYLDDQPLGSMPGGQTQQFLQLTPGKHQMRIAIAVQLADGQVKLENQTKDVTVENGKICYVAFGLKSPLDETGRVTVGTLVIQSVHGLSGEVFVDNFSVGHLEKNHQLPITHVTAGSHTYRIVGDKVTEFGSVMIRPNETEYAVLAPPPAPTGLRGTAQ